MRVLRKGGEFIDRRIRLHGSNALIFYVLSLAVAAASILFKWNLAGLLALVFVLLLFIESFGQWERWFLGKRGESKVIETLRSLPNDYVLLNDLTLPDGKGNVDHFVAGPNGLFVIETKNYSGFVQCEGDRWFVNWQKIRSLSRQAKGNAVAVRNSLEGLGKLPFVNPILVFTNPKQELKLYEPTVPVLRLDELVRFILNYRSAGGVPQEARRAIAFQLLSFQPNNTQTVPPSTSGLAYRA